METSQLIETQKNPLTRSAIDAHSEKGASHLVKEAAYILNNQVKISSSKKKNLLFFLSLATLTFLLVASYAAQQLVPSELLVSGGVIFCLMICRKFNLQ